MERLIGEYDRGQPGTSVLCIGSVHGSEPAGHLAAARVYERLTALQPPMRGRFIAVRGNLQALDAKRRFIDHDLNRLWHTTDVQRLLHADCTPNDGAEHREMRDLARIIHSATDASATPLCCLDLHSTSSECIPFFWLIPSPGVDQVLPAYGLPIVFDPQNRIVGTMAHYIASLGHEVVVAEGGQHDDALTIDHHEAILWITLVRVGCLDPDTVAEEYQRARTLLDGIERPPSQLFDIVHHHRIADGDGFEMLPGYDSFQLVAEGEHLARDRSGEIRAPMDGRILMPLYRPPCEDGFMIVRERERWPS